jgi:hypothetical protein
VVTKQYEAGPSSSGAFTDNREGRLMVRDGQNISIENLKYHIERIFKPNKRLRLAAIAGVYHYQIFHL